MSIKCNKDYNNLIESKEKIIINKYKGSNI